MKESADVWHKVSGQVEAYIETAVADPLEEAIDKRFGISKAPYSGDIFDCRDAIGVRLWDSAATIVITQVADHIRKDLRFGKGWE